MLKNYSVTSEKDSNHRKEHLLNILKGGGATPYIEDYGSIKEYYLVEEIGDPEEYVDWFHDIRNSRQSDIIKIHINCPGGNLFTTIQFIQALSECAGHIIMCVEGACMSAATLIFLMADEFVITEHSMFLFHNYSAGTAGKGGEMYHSMMHERNWSAKLFKSMYDGFLTDVEIKNMLEDKDIWMDASTVLDRLEKKVKTIKKTKKTNTV
jgi:ATP-dependent protease ClpP protease subunit